MERIVKEGNGSAVSFCLQVFAIIKKFSISLEEKS